jgi:hypothetical protein
LDDAASGRGPKFFCAYPADEEDLRAVDFVEHGLLDCIEQSQRGVAGEIDDYARFREASIFRSRAISSSADVPPPKWFCTPDTG